MFILPSADRRPSKADLFSKGFANTFKSSYEKSSKFYNDLTKEKRAAENQRIKDRASLAGLNSKELKAAGYKDTLAANPQFLEKLRIKSEEYFDRGLSASDAYRAAFDDLRKKPSGLSGERSKDSSERFRFGSSKPITAEDEEDPYRYGIASALKKHPKELLSDIPVSYIDAAEGIAELQNPLTALISSQFGGKKQPGVSEKLRELSGRNALPERAKEESDLLNFISAFIPFEKALALGKRGLNLLKGGEEAKALIEAINPAKEAAIGADGSAATLADEFLEAVGANKPKSLAGRAAESLETATEMRIARTAPESKLYQAEAQAATREKQLKNFPKYVEEIEADAAKRSAQQEARIPKTDKGRMNKELRAHEARKVFPQAEESYIKSAARVRALEAEAAKRPLSQRAEFKEIIEMAKKDLEAAEFNFKNALENRSGINYRASIQEMKEAARNKILQIEDAVLAEAHEGAEPYKLAKMDYSPDLIKEAKRIKKNKPLPRSREKDFYNDVHEVYANEYRDRLRKLEALGNKAPHTAAKEKEILKKMIESAEAEQAIHKHKFGLREMAERNKAQQRLSKFTAQQDQPKVRQAAETRMWKDRIQEIKTPDGQAKVAKEIAIEAGKPEAAPKVQEELGKFNKKARTLREAIIGEDASTAKEATKKGNKFAQEFKEMVDGFKKGLWEGLNTPIPKDVARGIVTAIWDDISEDILDEDLKIPTGALSNLAVGINRGGYATRAIAYGFTRMFLIKHQVDEAKKAFKEGDEAAFKKHSKYVQRKAKERSIDDLLAS